MKDNYNNDNSEAYVDVWKDGEKNSSYGEAVSKFNFLMTMF